jgi:hypothetical protein
MQITGTIPAPQSGTITLKRGSSRPEPLLRRDAGGFRHRPPCHGADHHPRVPGLLCQRDQRRERQRLVIAPGTIENLRILLDYSAERIVPVEDSGCEQVARDFAGGGAVRIIDTLKANGAGCHEEILQALKSPHIGNT